MVHETHYKFRGPWRRSGGGSLGFFCCPRVVLVTGDLAPIGEACVRGGGCLFLWRRRYVKRFLESDSGYWFMLHVQPSPGWSSA